MMMLNRWNPVREFEAAQRQLFAPFLRNLQQPDDLWNRGWAPAVDVEETTDTIVIRAELPGIDPDEVSIDYDNGRLTISGERQFDEETEGRTWHRVERGYGAFSRSFVLPNMIDADKAEARFENGVLELVMPKREEARRRRIEINGSSSRQIGSKSKRLVEAESKKASSAA